MRSNKVVAARQLLKNHFYFSDSSDKVDENLFVNLRFQNLPVHVGNYYIYPKTVNILPGEATKFQNTMQCNGAHDILQCVQFCKFISWHVTWRTGKFYGVFLIF